MNWVFDHLQLIIAIAGGIAWWLKQKKQAQSDGEVPPPAEERSFEDPELAERTRRIREEIQRKIEQRAKGYATEQPKPLPAEPTAPPIMQEVVVTQASPRMRMAPTRAEAQRQAEVLEQQAALAERLREAELMKAATLKRAEFEAATADHAAAARTLSRSTVLDDLRDPAALRRAFILREVLGPPLALR